MILYATKLTIDRYSLVTVDELIPQIEPELKDIVQKETGDALLEWGMKLFYFDGKKCLLLINRASRFGVIMPDFKKRDMSNMGDCIGRYLMEMYKDEADVLCCLMRMFADTKVCVVKPIKDKSLIAVLNHSNHDFLFDGYRLADYIWDGILHSIELNRDYNFDFLVTGVVDGQKTYFMPGERFRQLLLERYGRE